MLSINNISFAYGNVQILNNVNFEVAPGKCIGIIGANGCGKSTLLSIIAGSRKPNTGSVTHDKGDFIAYVPQENPLMPDLSGYDNLLLWFKGSRKALKEKLDSELIKMLGIDTYIKKPVKKLSGGMKKKLSLAMALINSPSYIIMDEPGAALDLPTKAEMDSYLEKYIASGGSIIITTHDEAELNLCDEIYVICNKTIKKVDKNIRGRELLDVLIGKYEE